MLVGGRQQKHVCLHDAWILPLPAGDLANDEGSTEGLGWDKVAWQKVSPPPSQCRWGHAAARIEDPLTKSEVVAVFGGRKEVIDGGTRTGIFDYNNELWLFGLAGSTFGSDDTTDDDTATTGNVNATSFAKAATGGTWTLAEGAPGAAVPAKRDHHSLSYDSAGYAL
jgi:hypothetical protein